MTSTEKMREEFEAAFVEEMVFRCGEGYRPSVLFILVEKEPDGAYSSPIPQAAWWAWQASRAALVVGLPDRFSEKYQDYFEDVDGGCFNEGRYIADVHEAIEAAGLKVAK